MVLILQWLKVKLPDRSASTGFQNVVTGQEALKCGTAALSMCSTSTVRLPVISDIVVLTESKKKLLCHILHVLSE